MTKHGILWGSRTYLSGSIENSKDASTWRETAKKRLSKIGVICFDPLVKPFTWSYEENEETRLELARAMKSGDFDWVHKRMRDIRNEDLRLCDIVDFGLVLVNPKVASWGTANELYQLNAQKKPCFVIVEGGKKKTPLWLMGVLPPHYFYNSLEDALIMIEKIDSGKREIDSSRWRLLKEEYRSPGVGA